MQQRIFLSIERVQFLTDRVKILRRAPPFADGDCGFVVMLRLPVLFQRSQGAGEIDPVQNVVGCQHYEFLKKTCGGFEASFRKIVACFPPGDENESPFQIAEQCHQCRVLRRGVSDDQLFESVVGIGIHDGFGLDPEHGDGGADALIVSIPAFRIGENVEGFDETFEFFCFLRRTGKQIGMALAGLFVIGFPERRKITVLCNIQQFVVGHGELIQPV